MHSFAQSRLCFNCDAYSHLQSRLCNPVTCAWLICYASVIFCLLIISWTWHLATIYRNSCSILVSFNPCRRNSPKGVFCMCTMISSAQVDSFYPVSIIITWIVCVYHLHYHRLVSSWVIALSVLFRSWLGFSYTVRTSWNSHFFCWFLLILVMVKASLDA